MSIMLSGVIGYSRGHGRLPSVLYPLSGGLGGSDTTIQIFWKMIEAVPALDQTSSNCRSSEQIRSGEGILDASSPLWKGGGLSG